MGEYSKEITASSGCGEVNRLDSSKAHHVGIITEEDRRRSKSAMGEGEGAAEEGGLEQAWIAVPEVQLTAELWQCPAILCDARRWLEPTLARCLSTTGVTTIYAVGTRKVW